MLGPRWFVPKRWRRDPLSYEYNRHLSSTVVQEEEAGSSEEMICVICMNPIRHEVDVFGGLVKNQNFTIP